MPAQDIPVVRDEESVTHGLLPNGMSYFVSQNSDEKGFADFALVRKDNAAATEYNIHHLEDVMVSSSAYVMDSTLLSLMRAAGNHMPAYQAVMVAGDVDTAAVVEKMRLLSYMIPAGDTVAVEPYVWQEKGRNVDVISGSDRSLSVIKAEWTMARTPKEYMNTVQPAVSSLFIGQLGLVACDRLTGSFFEAGIPATDISFSHTDSGMSSGDETFSVSVTVAPGHSLEAAGIVGRVMASLDAGTASVREVNRAQARYLESRRTAVSPAYSDNSGYIARFVSSFLYGGSLAREEEIFSFQSSRVLDDSVKLSFFNDISAALLDAEKNFTLQVTSSENIEPERLASAFDAGWAEGGRWVCIDRPGLDAVMPDAVQETKVKIRTTRKETVSGGTMTRFANGLTMVSKDLSSDSRVWFSLSLNGGYADIPGLKPGEGKYVGKYLECDSVAGLSGRDFRAALSEKGISIGFEVTASHTVIKGYGPKYGLESIVKALSLVTGSRSHDPEAFAYVQSCIPLRTETMKGTYDERMSEISAIMCPDDDYSGFRNVEALSDDFAAKAEAFISRQFRKMDDGVMIFVGDVDEDELRAVMSAHAGLFPTLRKNSIRPGMHYRTVSGVSTYIFEGKEAGVDVAVSCMIPVTVDNLVAGAIAVEMLRQAAEKNLETVGWQADVVYDFSIFPDERLNVVVSLSERTDTFVSDEEPVSAMEAAGILSATMSSLPQMTVPAARLAGLKAYVKNRIEIDFRDPEFVTDAVNSRFLYGKDLATGCMEKVDAVAPEDVIGIFSALNASGKVEYIVNRF